MDRKQSAVIRIIAWSVASLALFIILIMGIRGQLWNFGFGYLSLSSNYENSDNYQAGGGEIAAGDLTDLEINWLDGRVDIETYDGETVQFSEESRHRLDEDEMLHYYYNNGKLILQYSAAHKNLSRSLNKKLYIKIPKETALNLGMVAIDATSSNMKISGLNTEKFTVDSTSGDINIVDCSGENIYLDATSGMLKAVHLEVKDRIYIDKTSGNTELSGSFQNVTYGATSGNFKLESDICPSELSTDTTSGNVTLIIPENDGFNYRKDTTSGSFSCDFEVISGEDSGTYKDGGAKFSFDATSGNITIKKK